PSRDVQSAAEEVRGRGAGRPPPAPLAPPSLRKAFLPGLSRRSRRRAIDQNIIANMGMIPKGLARGIMIRQKLERHDDAKKSHHALWEDIAMATRRTMLFASAAAGASLALRTGDVHAVAPSTVRTPVDFDVPRGACDCHVHVFDPARFPYFSGRV